MTSPGVSRPYINVISKYNAKQRLTLDMNAAVRDSKLKPIAFFRSVGVYDTTEVAKKKVKELEGIAYNAAISYLDLVFSISRTPPPEFSAVLVKHCCARGVKAGNNRLQAPRESIFKNRALLTPLLLFDAVRFIK